MDCWVVTSCFAYEPGNEYFFVPCSAIQYRIARHGLLHAILLENNMHCDTVFVANFSFSQSVVQELAGPRQAS